MASQESTLNKQENDIRLKQNASFVGSSNDPFSTPTRDNYQTYPYDYYAGTDCKIFFGDVWVDDIITLNYTTNQSKTPIFGYASQNFDAVAKGQVLVEGQFTIAFKETGYLNLIQATLEEQRVNASDLIKGKIKKLQEGDQQKFIPGLTTINDNSKEKLDFSYSANGTPQIIRQSQTIEQVLTSKKATDVLNSKFGGTSSKDFEDFAEILEDSIWGDSNGKAMSLENKLKRADEFDYADNGGILTAKGHNYADVLNIMLTFGDINDTRAEHTLIVLNDVHITNTSMVITPNGDPIGESYTFIARDINKSINTKANVFNINPIKLNIGNGVKLSKLEDVNAIEEFLNHKDQTNNFNIQLVAALLNNQWISTGFSKNKGTYQTTFNKVEPFTDQLCKFVENQANNLIPENFDTNYTQIIMTVDFGNSIGFEEVNDKITMILEQTVPGTRTYKVISPTRTGFSLNNIITRDDVWDTVLQNPTSMDLSAVEQSKNRAQADDINETLMAGSTKTDTPEESRKKREDQLKETNKSFVGPLPPTQEQLAFEDRKRAIEVDKNPELTDVLYDTNSSQTITNSDREKAKQIYSTQQSTKAVKEVNKNTVPLINNDYTFNPDRLDIQKEVNKIIPSLEKKSQSGSKKIFDNLKGDPMAPFIIQ